MLPRMDRASHHWPRPQSSHDDVSRGDDMLALIRLDSYQIDRTHQTVAERVAANYDHPDAYDWVLLNDHLSVLMTGESVLAPSYDFTVHNRSDVVREIRPAAVIVVEG